MDNYFSSPWKEIAKTWKNMKSPNIPNRGEVEIYEKYIKTFSRKKNAKALVLGATYQVRDLLFINKIETVVCDTNIDMIAALTKLCRDGIADKEIWIKSDWLNIPLADNYFDIILADGAINQLPLGSYLKFLRNIRRLLRRDGLFIQRTGVTRREFFRDDSEILYHFLKQKDPKPDIVFEALALFSSALERETMEISVKRIYHIMDSHVARVSGEDRKKLKGIIRKMEKSYPRSDKIWTMILIEDMVSYYKSVFSKIKIESVKNYDVFIPAYPFFIVKK